MNCPNCGGQNVIKKGKRKTKFGFRQFYYCKDCEKGFVGSKLPHKTYGPKVIASAINCYNLGHTLEESANLTNRRFKVKVSKSSVGQWLKELRHICTYNKIRPEIAKNYEKESKYNNACRLANFALKSCDINPVKKFSLCLV